MGKKLQKNDKNFLKKMLDFSVRLCYTLTILKKGGTPMRYYDEVWGWGTILEEGENLLVVQFDADPWYEHIIPKQGK